MKYFETPADNPEGRQLCRIKNFFQYREGLDGLLRGEKVFGILSELMEEPAVGLKRKPTLNYLVETVYYLIKMHLHLLLSINIIILL